MNYKEQNRLVQEAFEEGHHSGDEVRVYCPLCDERTGKPDHRRCLSINTESGLYRCFKCDARGRLGGFEEWDYRDRPEPEEKDEREWEMPSHFKAFSEDSYHLNYRGQFLRDRGVSFDVCRRVGIGGGSVRSAMAFRVVVPVRNASGSLRGWVGRLVDESYIPECSHRLKTMPKYFYPKGFKREDVLFNEAALFVPREEYDFQMVPPVLVVEGVFDALPHWPNAVACLGKPAEKQIEILAQSTRPIVVCMDGDAWEEGQALAWRLQVMGVEASYIRLPPDMDPGDIDPGSMIGMAGSALEDLGGGAALHPTGA